MSGTLFVLRIDDLSILGQGYGYLLISVVFLIFSMTSEQVSAYYPAATQFTMALIAGSYCEMQRISSASYSCGALVVGDNRGESVIALPL